MRGSCNKGAAKAPKRSKEEEDERMMRQRIPHSELRLSLADHKFAVVVKGRTVGRFSNEETALHTAMTDYLDEPTVMVAGDGKRWTRDEIKAGYAQALSERSVRADGGRWVA
jgi:hypothetical protein